MVMRGVHVRGVHGPRDERGKESAHQRCARTSRRLRASAISVLVLPARPQMSVISASVRAMLERWMAKEREERPARSLVATRAPCVRVPAQVGECGWVRG